MVPQVLMYYWRNSCKIWQNEKIFTFIKKFYIKHLQGKILVLRILCFAKTHVFRQRSSTSFGYFLGRLLFWRLIFGDYYSQNRLISYESFIIIINFHKELMAYGLLLSLKNETKNMPVLLSVGIHSFLKILGSTGNKP